MRSRLALFAAALAVAPAASAAQVASPSPSACAVAWNLRAGDRLHLLIARSRARAAFVNSHASFGTFTWSKSGGTRSTSSRGCSIQFILPSRKILGLWGTWEGGTVRTWQGPVRSLRAVPVPDNARVRVDGTVGFHG
jgi:hypothetical protein